MIFDLGYRIADWGLFRFGISDLGSSRLGIWDFGLGIISIWDFLDCGFGISALRLIQLRIWDGIESRVEIEVSASFPRKAKNKAEWMIAAESGCCLRPFWYGFYF